MVHAKFEDVDRRKGSRRDFQGRRCQIHEIKSKSKNKKIAKRTTAAPPLN